MFEDGRVGPDDEETTLVPHGDVDASWVFYRVVIAREDGVDPTRPIDLFRTGQFRERQIRTMGILLAFLPPPPFPAWRRTGRPSDAAATNRGRGGPRARVPRGRRRAASEARRTRSTHRYA